MVDTYTIDGAYGNCWMHWLVVICSYQIDESRAYWIVMVSIIHARFAIHANTSI